MSAQLGAGGSRAFTHLVPDLGRLLDEGVHKVFARVQICKGECELASHRNLLGIARAHRG
jgi:hypothetical protein